MVTTFSTLTTRHAEFSLAANVLYQILSPVLRTTAAAQHAHGHVRYTSHVHSWSSRRPKNFETSSRPTLVVSSEGDVLTVQGNLASTYNQLGRLEDASQIEREVYFGRLKLDGEENEKTLIAAINYASTLRALKRFEEAKALFRKTIPVARRVLGGVNRITLKMRMNYAEALYRADAPLDDLREAVTTLEDAERTARRVLGGTHPTTRAIDGRLQISRTKLAARETPTRSA